MPASSVAIIFLAITTMILFSFYVFTELADCLGAFLNFSSRNQLDAPFQKQLVIMLVVTVCLLVVSIITGPILAYW